MKLVLDANLSRRIVPLLADRFPGSAHISQVGLAGETPDFVIWEFAKQHHFSVLTSDADFVRLAEAHGAPPQVIQLERMDYSTEVAVELIRREAMIIVEFEKSGRSILVLRRT